MTTTTRPIAVLPPDAVVPVADPALRHKIQAVLSQGILAQSDPLPSPCISVCKMDEPRHFCIGCLRSLQELRDWGSASSERRRAIWLEVIQRSGSPSVP